jgi:polysaccharide biosynthesis transport protein
MARRVLASMDSATSAVDGREVLAVLRRSKWTIAGTAIVGTLVATIVLVLLPSHYKAVALLLVDPQETQIIQLHTPVSNLSLTADSGLIKTESGILGSDEIIRRVVTRMRLFDRPEFRKTPGILDHVQRALLDALPESLSPRSVSDAHDQPGSERKTSQPSASDGEIPNPNAIAYAAETYRRAFSVSNNEGSHLIELSFEAENPDLATAVLREHIEVYLEQKKDSTAAANRRAVAWLKDQRTTLEAKLRDKQQEAQQFRQQNNIISLGATTAVVQRLTELNTELSNAQAHQAELEARVQQLHRAGSAAGGIFSVPEVLASHLIEAYRAQQADLLRRQAEILQQYGPRHPKVLAMNAEVDNLEAKIAQEVGRIAKGLSNEMSAENARVAALRADYKTVEQQATSQERAAVKLQALDREVATMQQLDENLFSKEKEIGANGELQIPYAQMISPPTLQDSRSPKLFLIGAIAGGSLSLGALIAFLRERLDDRLRSLDDAEEAFEVSGVGGIPLIPRARRSRSLPCDEVLQRPTSLYAERVRSLGRSIQGASKEDARIILVTSALPGEGKTSLTLSLGRSLARIGNDVLVIEGDLRRPMLSRLLLPPDVQGPDLADCLSGRATFAESIRTDPKSPLQYYAIRRPPEVPQDLLETDEMQTLMQAARLEFDYILIDSPPVAAVSDALFLARFADVVLLVVRWNHTAKSLVHSTLSRLKQEALTPIRLVLSNIDVRNRAAFRQSDFEYHLRKAHYYYERRDRSGARF